MISKHRRKKFNDSNLRRLRFESLEPRRVLDGIVTVAVNGAGQLVLIGDTANNQVQVNYGSTPGTFFVASVGGTLLTDGGTPSTATLTETGATGGIVVRLGAGATKSFEFGDNPPAAPPSPLWEVPTINILNAAGTETNTINNVLLDTLTTNMAPTGATQVLSVLSTHVLGLTTVNNTGGVGGNTMTTIDGTASKTALDGGLLVTNPNANNIFMTTGSVSIGAALFPTPLPPPVPAPALPPVLEILNGTAGATTRGSSTVFTGNATIYGSVIVTGQAHPLTIPPTQDIVKFIGSTVYGGVTVTDLGGTTSVSVTSSTIGAQLTNTAAAGGALVINNNTAPGAAAGFAAVTISGASNIPWGVFVNDGAATGASAGSLTTITGGTIGTRLGTNPVPGFATLGDALTVLGENAGLNNFTMTGTTLGGVVNFVGAGLTPTPGVNFVTISNSTMAGLIFGTALGSAGGNNVTLTSDTIQQTFSIIFGNGSNNLTLAGTMVLPNELTGISSIIGIGGVDFLSNQAGVPLMIQGDFVTSSIAIGP
ncbi:MAG TPA: hypothetical protein VFE46_00250 [Pirellulales bacterium]|jgi:hypothetical protein|nr:hypothetical protein [Pirellulales bacterium]